MFSQTRPELVIKSRRYDETPDDDVLPPPRNGTSSNIAAEDGETSTTTYKPEHYFLCGADLGGYLSLSNDSGRKGSRGWKIAFKLKTHTHERYHVTVRHKTGIITPGETRHVHVTFEHPSTATGVIDMRNLVESSMSPYLADHLILVESFAFDDEDLQRASELKGISSTDDESNIALETFKMLERGGSQKAALAKRGIVMRQKVVQCHLVDFEAYTGILQDKIECSRRDVYRLTMARAKAVELEDKRESRRRRHRASSALSSRSSNTPNSPEQGPMAQPPPMGEDVVNGRSGPLHTPEPTDADEASFVTFDWPQTIAACVLAAVAGFVMNDPNAL